MCLIQVWEKGTRSKPVEWLENVAMHVLGEYWFTQTMIQMASISW